MATETIPFDASEFFADAEAQAALLTDAFESGDAAYIANALGIIAKAKGMTRVAREAGVTREALYKALSERGDPKFSTILGVAKALGLKFTVTPASGPAE
ncbi:addiction module antidote protein [Ciceribacter thiooxidans]|uniref:Addiction module antidote protein n=1 Tax=Ciceribacter thiooxidans TaxID=1969821 RepID=A0ABV7I229_9HYPH|nr:addiction module antidote protein [Ciceribacter thiooxidans]MDI6837551.1 putative addiction module antidote protein [Rhizobiaceae bacterium]